MGRRSSGGPKQRYAGRMSRLLRRLISPTPPATVQRDTVRLRLEDAEIEVLRVRDPRARRIKLSVDERGARLTLPPRASLVMGERFLEQHRDWLALQLRQYQSQGLPAPLQPGEDGVLPLRGELAPLRWQEGRYARLEIDEHGACVQCRPVPAMPPCAACCASSTKHRPVPMSAAGCRPPCHVHPAACG